MRYAISPFDPEYVKSSVCLERDCGRRFERDRDLQRHVDSVHCRVKKHQCPTCRRRFSRKDTLHTYGASFTFASDVTDVLQASSEEALLQTSRKPYRNRHGNPVAIAREPRRTEEGAIGSARSDILAQYAGGEIAAVAGGSLPPPASGKSGFRQFLRSRGKMAKCELAAIPRCSVTWQTSHIFRSSAWWLCCAALARRR